MAYVSRVEYHPYFAAQFEALCCDEDQFEVAGEIAALLDALEQHSHDIEGEASREEVAVVMLMGDKTALGNNWYPSKVNDIENRLVPDWERAHATHRAQVRRIR